MGMEVLHIFLLALLGRIAFPILIHAQDQSGFISIDCGLPENSSYTETITGINYISDATFIDTGVSKNISSEFRQNSLPQELQWYVRSFPEGSRNCYNVPEFELHLGANLWDTVKLDDASTTTTKEMIHVPLLNYIYVCLVNTGFGTPFISAIELRPLKSTIYDTQSGSLLLFLRLDIGSTTSQTIRYEDDVYDRIWSPLKVDDGIRTYNLYWTQLNTSLAINSQSYNDYQPPSIVMRTAAMPTDASESLSISWNSPDQITQFYVYMHFAEFEKLQVNQSREFNISLNGKNWHGPIVPGYLQATTVSGPSALGEINNEFCFDQSENSTLPPIINAIEIYTVNELPQSPTNQEDVDAIMNIKSMYGVKRNWHGDPCAPQAYLWDGLNCSYKGFDPPRIMSLDLSSSGLTGEIAPYLSNLTLIQYLDLSNNDLTGSVPDFLTQLPYLRVLNLKQNKLTGSVPVELIERSKNGSLSLSVGKNPNLCSSVPCKKNKRFVVPVVASIATLFILVIALTIFWSLQRRKQQVSLVEQADAKSNQTYGISESKDRQFTYYEVLRITNNFERVLGEGRFGTVFHGYLDDSQVAVKMFSPSSVQGLKQFQAEVKILKRVHHKNLTNFVGYCDEGTNIGLIYEYMANGTLEDHLSDSSTDNLNWEGRLRIALEAAQGLEYLHNGCKPPIVHRNVKPTKILLNDKFQAKLADFGLSRTFPIEVSTIVVGNPGYLDPEYYASNRLTKESDVFSFGVVLLEMITNQPAIAKNHDKTHISQWVSFMLPKGDIKNIVDPRLQGDFDINTAWKAVEIAISCVSPTSTKRPTMKDVVTELNECLAAEIARTKGGNETRSRGSIEMVTVNLHTGLFPVAR